MTGRQHPAGWPWHRPVDLLAPQGWLTGHLNAVAVALAHARGGVRRDKLDQIRDGVEALYLAASRARAAVRKLAITKESP